MRVAIIGTAGRDRFQPMSCALWAWMVEDARRRLGGGGLDLVSGGAAWADHVAVALFLQGAARSLTLHLPAPIHEGGFDGPPNSAGSAANFYHEKFSRTIGENTLDQIRSAFAFGATATVEPVAPGYAAMFNRNRKVAQADAMLAYTFGRGPEPADGGTKNTWGLCNGIRVHVPLPENYV